MNTFFLSANEEVAGNADVEACFQVVSENKVLIVHSVNDEHKFLGEFTKDEARDVWRDFVQKGYEHVFHVDPAPSCALVRSRVNDFGMREGQWVKVVVDLDKWYRIELEDGFQTTIAKSWFYK